jgi:hypothetical protein
MRTANGCAIATGLAFRRTIQIEYWRPFYRVRGFHRPRDRRYGLAITARIMALHGGKARARETRQRADCGVVLS